MIESSCFGGDQYQTMKLWMTVYERDYNHLNPLVQLPRYVLNEYGDNNTGTWKCSETCEGFTSKTIMTYG